MKNIHDKKHDCDCGSSKPVCSQYKEVVKAGYELHLESLGKDPDYRCQCGHWRKCHAKSSK